MTCDPLSQVIDEPLALDASVTEPLRAYRLAAKYYWQMV